MDEKSKERWFAETSSDEGFAAWSLVDDAIESGPENGWETVMELVEHAADDAMFNLVGAGPLEDLIHEWPEELITQVDSAARRNPKFRRCLESVWEMELPPAMQAVVRKYRSTDHNTP